MGRMPRTPLHVDIARLDHLASWLDDRFRIPGTHIRMGLDGLVGLIPGVGDTVTLAPTLYVIWRAWRHGAPLGLIVKMLVNAAIDWLLGLVPLLGDLLDIGFKANLRNVRLLQAHLHRRHNQPCYTGA